MEFLILLAARVRHAGAIRAPLRAVLPWRFRAGAVPALLLLILLLVAGLPLSLRAQAPAAASLEYQVKAAFLLNFTKFAAWPEIAFAAPDSPIGICVLGDDPFGPVLDRIVAGETVNGRLVRVQRLTQRINPRSCQVLFISRSERGDLDLIFSELRGYSVLTVSELPGFTRAGGMIEFIIQEGKVRFYINAAAANAARVTLSSQLLRVAAAVQGTAASR